MEIKINTKEDSHDDIRKVIKLLQHIIGESQEVFTNQPQTTQETTSAFNNIFGDASSSQPTATETNFQSTEAQSEETSQSTEDLFAELFSEEEIKKMDTAAIKDEDDNEELNKTKGKKYNIDFY